MANLQEIYERIKQNKAEQKIIRDAYKSELANCAEYQEIKDALDELKEKKKQIENGFKQEMAKDFEKLESLKLDIETDNEMMSDLALNSMMKGETVAIEDEFGQKYEPVFRVRFQKVN